MGVASMRRNRKRRMKKIEKEAEVSGEGTTSQEPVEETATTESTTTKETTTKDTTLAPTPLPETFPGYEELIVADYDTYESLEGMSSEDLQAIHGIGKVTAEKILTKYNEWYEAQ